MKASAFVGFGKALAKQLSRNADSKPKPPSKQLQDRTECAVLGPPLARGSDATRAPRLGEEPAGLHHGEAPARLQRAEEAPTCQADCRPRETTDQTITYEKLTWSS